MKIFYVVFMVMITMLLLMTVVVHPVQAATQNEVLTWSADNTDTDLSSDVTLTAYNVYSSPTTTGTFSKIATVPTTLANQVTTYTDMVVLPPANTSSQKCYQVTAVNAAGESGPSNTYCKTFFGPAVFPSAPTGLTGN